MATLYLYEKDGSSPITCSGTVLAGRCSYLGGGLFLTNNNNVTRIYHVDGTNVTFVREISGGNWQGVAAIKDPSVAPPRYEHNMFFAVRHLTQQL